MRGRKPILINKDELQKIVSQLESSRTFKTRGELWECVSQTEWAKNSFYIPLSAQVASIKSKSMGITVNTPIGKKGNMEVAREARGQTKKVPLTVTPNFGKMYPSQEGRIEKFSKGSLKAAIGLKCLDCCGMDKQEVGLCTIVECSLFAHRPYKHKLSLTSEGRVKISLGLVREA